MTGQPTAHQTRRPFMAELQNSKRAGASSPGAPAVGVEGPATGTLAAPLAAPAALDQTQVLSAIAELSAKMDRFISTDQVEIEKIQMEIFDISGRIKATKAEMAALRHPPASDDGFPHAPEELTAVVSAAEGATNAIMAAAKGIDPIVHEVKSHPLNGYGAGRANDPGEPVTRQSRGARLRLVMARTQWCGPSSPGSRISPDGS